MLDVLTKEDSFIKHKILHKQRIWEGPSILKSTGSEHKLPEWRKAPESKRSGASFTSQVTGNAGKKLLTARKIP